MHFKTASILLGKTALQISTWCIFICTPNEKMYNENYEDLKLCMKVFTETMRHIIDQPFKTRNLPPLPPLFFLFSLFYLKIIHIANMVLYSILNYIFYNLFYFKLESEELLVLHPKVAHSLHMLGELERVGCKRHPAGYQAKYNDFNR